MLCRVYSLLEPLEMRREWEWKGYIRLVSHTLHQFLSCLIALRNMLVNHTRVKGHECLTSLSKILLISLCSVLEYFYRTSFMVRNFFLIYLISSQLSRDFLHMPTLSRSARTRVWMSTFIRTSSHSQLAKSLDDCPRQEKKPGVKRISRNY